MLVLVNLKFSQYLTLLSHQSGTDWYQVNIPFKHVFPYHDYNNNLLITLWFSFLYSALPSHILLGYSVLL